MRIEKIIVGGLKKMKYTEKINKFMLKRNNILEKDYNFFGYYTKEDEKDILSWNEGRAEECWEEMIRDSLQNIWTCPFCDYYRFYVDNSCLSCSYGGRHGICNVIYIGPNKSTWIKLRNNTNMVDEMLISGIHKDIIDEIEEQDKKMKELKVPVEVYSRVVGYYRPTAQWNKGKQEEFRQRKEYKMIALDVSDK
jgi:hypothetical protein